MMKLEEALEYFKDLSLTNDFMRLAYSESFARSNDDNFIALHMNKIVKNMREAIKIYNYIHGLVYLTGILVKSENGKYCIAGSDIYYSNNDLIEIFDKNEIWGGEFILTTIKSKDGDYYAEGMEGQKLDGLMVRFRA